MRYAPTWWACRPRWSHALNRAGDINVKRVAIDYMDDRAAREAGRERRRSGGQALRQRWAREARRWALGAWWVCNTPVRVGSGAAALGDAATGAGSPALDAAGDAEDWGLRRAGGEQEREDEDEMAHGWDSDWIGRGRTRTLDWLINFARMAGELSTQ